jgi:HEAT repeat protein
MNARNRRDFVPPARRLLDAPDEEVRTAALRALTAVGGPDEHAILRRALSDPSPPVRATALVGLILSSGDAARFADDVRAVVEAPEREGRLALAQAIRRSPGPVFHDILVQLAAIPEPDLQAETAGIIAAAPDPSFLPLLLPMLGDRVARPEARAAMVAVGGPALAMLDHAMSDPALPRRLRMHLPRTVSRFGSQAAANVLSRHLEDERDEAVGHKILRGLGRLIAENEHIRTDPDLIDRNLTAVLTRAITVLGWRLTIAEHMAATMPTPAGVLLVELLREKEETSTERAFRLLGLRYPDEDMHAVYVGLHSGDVHGVASGRGVVEHLVTGPMRDALLALVAHGDHDDRERLALAAPFAPPAAAGLAGALRAMMFDPSDAVVGLAAHHIGELDAGELTHLEGSELLSSLEQRTGNWIDAANQALLAMRAVKEPLAG